jgi:isoquinoline 1-oxidoreductase beta subunit
MGDRGRTMQSDDTAARGFGRRRFLGYVLAAPTLVVAAQFDETVLSPDRAAAAGISVPEPSEIFDLTDMLTTAALPTSGLISIQLNADGTASFALPRAEVGQGITTSSAMLIAEELDIPLADVRITLAAATRIGV